MIFMGNYRRVPARALIGGQTWQGLPRFRRFHRRWQGRAEKAGQRSAGWRKQAM